MKIELKTLCKRLGTESLSLIKTLELLPSLSEHGAWIAGGAVRRTFQSLPLDSDFDFFFASKEQSEKFKSKLKEKGAVLTSTTEKCTTFKVPEKDGQPAIKVQVIEFSFFSSPEQLIDSFDFTLAQFAFDGQDFYVGDFSLWDVARKRLVPHKVTYGVSTLRRIIKYTNQGFTVCSGGLAEILQQVVDNPEIIQKETLYID